MAIFLWTQNGLQNEKSKKGLASEKDTCLKKYVRRLFIMERYFFKPVLANPSLGARITYLMKLIQLKQCVSIKTTIEFPEKKD